MGSGHYVYKYKLSKYCNRVCTATLLYTYFFYCRELLEESGLTTNELQEAGILKFEFVGEPEILEVHVFTTNKYEGTPTESEGKKITRIYLITYAAVTTLAIICNPVSANKCFHIKCTH